MRKFLAALIIVFLAHSVSEAAILIEDGKARKSAVAQNRIAADGISMRKVRRVGIGATAAGPLGFLGANLELNFTSRWGIAGGFGGSAGSYQAYTFQIKHVLAGEWLLPYMTLGYAKWYTVGKPTGSISETNPPFLYERFLSQTQRSSGDFSIHLIYPSFGLQYMQLKGPWAGYSMFAEIVMLLEVEDFEAVPTGTLGFLYYF